MVSQPPWLRACPQLPRMLYTQVEAVKATVLPRDTYVKDAKYLNGDK